METQQTPEAIFQKTYEQYRSELLAYIGRRGSDALDAEDAVDTAFIRFFQRLRQADTSEHARLLADTPERARALLFMLVDLAYIDGVRRRRRDREILSGLAFQFEAPADPVGASADEDSTDPRVALLWNRLGPENRNMLLSLAQAFGPNETFTLEDAAAALQTTKGSLRARIMNIGRSLKSLGAPGALWRRTWDDEARANRYVWDNDVHEWLIEQVRQRMT
jgi:DNA-directed RNA polymerase specialized sigma24 family protein